MSSRRNFLDADNSVMERNLRFVKNDLEENLNQYFGGSAGRDNNSTNVLTPPRDYKVVQPKPVQSNEMDIRRKFLLQLGLPRHEAYDLAKNADFDVNHLEQKCSKYFERGFSHLEVMNEILSTLRNHTNRTENTRKGPIIPTFSEAQQHNKNLYSIEYKDREYHSLSRSYEPSRKDRRERSFSPNQGFNIHSPREREEYFSLQVNNRDEVRRETSYEGSHSRPYFPSENARREKYKPPSISRSSNIGYNEELYRKRTYSPPRNDHREERLMSSRSRSPNRGIRQNNYSPPRNCREEECYRLSRSPNRVNSEELYRQIPYSGTRNGQREELNLLPSIGVIEPYRQHASSPPRKYLREERYHSSRSRSSNRDDNREQHRQHLYPQPINDRREEGIREQYRQYSYSPPLTNCREERYHSSRGCSPNNLASPIQHRKHDGINFQDNYMCEIRRDSIRDRSRSFSPSKIDIRSKYYRSSRSPSPFRSFIETSPEKYCSQQDDFENKNFEQLRARAAYSPNINDCITNTRKLQTARQNLMLAGTQNDTYRARTLHKQENRSTNNRNIPSLLTLDVFPQKRISTELGLQNSSVPSLLDLQVFSNQNDLGHPSTSKKLNYHSKESNKRPKEEMHDRKNITKFTNIKYTKKPNDDNKEVVLKPNIAEVPIIQSGLMKPAPGHLKANPRDYWSQWWPRYKYIENTIPNINPDDIEVKSCLFYLLEPNSSESRKRTYSLLNKGVRTIMNTVDINETNYYLRDIFQLFQYKKHLEDPNFQNTLSSEQLNCIAPALRQFQIKPIMALLHQALIVRWHVSVDIMKKAKAGQPVMSTHAKNLLNDKSFHYFVMKSIKELKKMCQQDWPQFNEFYKNLKGQKINIRELQ